METNGLEIPAILTAPPLSFFFGRGGGHLIKNIYFFVCKNPFLGEKYIGTYIFYNFVAVFFIKLLPKYSDFVNSDDFTGRSPSEIYQKKSYLFLDL